MPRSATFPGAAARAPAPPRFALGVHSHEPPPAAAARTRKDVEGEHPAQQRRRPRRTLTRRSHRRRGVRRRLGAPRNDPRPPRRVWPEHAMKARRVKTRGRNQQCQLLDELQRSSSRCVAPSARRCGSSNTTCARARAGTLTFACSENPSRRAHRGLAPSTIAAADRSRRTRCPARGPLATSPWIEAAAYSASNGSRSTSCAVQESRRSAVNSYRVSRQFQGRLAGRRGQLSACGG